MWIGSKLFASLLLLSPTICSAHVDGIAQGQGSYGGISVRRIVVATSPGYKGPADLVSGATAWYGLRAIDAGAAGRAAQLIRVHRLNDDQQCDVLAASDGGFGVTGNCEQTASNGQTADIFCSATTCVVVRLYDQTNANNCASASCDLRQTIVSAQPTLTSNCLGTLPCITLVGVQQFLTATPLTLPQPFTIVTAASYTGTALAETIDAGGNEVQLGFGAFSTDDVYATAGTLAHVAGFAPGAFRTIQFVANDPSASALEVNGAATSITAGTNGFASQIDLGAMVGQFVEGGIWPTALSGAQRANLTNNMRAYWGF